MRLNINLLLIFLILSLFLIIFTNSFVVKKYNYENLKLNKTETKYIYISLLNDKFNIYVGFCDNICYSKKLILKKDLKDLLLNKIDVFDYYINNKDNLEVGFGNLYILNNVSFIKKIKLKLNKTSLNFMIIGLNHRINNLLDLIKYNIYFEIKRDYIFDFNKEIYFYNDKICIKREIYYCFNKNREFLLIPLKELPIVLDKDKFWDDFNEFFKGIPKIINITKIPWNYFNIVKISYIIDNLPNYLLYKKIDIGVKINLTTGKNFVKFGYSIINGIGKDLIIFKKKNNSTILILYIKNKDTLKKLKEKAKKLLEKFKEVKIDKNIFNLIKINEGITNYYNFYSYNLINKSKIWEKVFNKYFLNKIKENLKTIDNKLKLMFENLDKSGFLIINVTIPEKGSYFIYYKERITYYYSWNKKFIYYKEFLTNHSMLFDKTKKEGIYFDGKNCYKIKNLKNPKFITGELILYKKNNYYYLNSFKFLSYCMKFINNSQFCYQLKIKYIPIDAKLKIIKNKLIEMEYEDYKIIYKPEIKIEEIKCKKI